MTRKFTQSGVALITVLLVVALATTAAVAMATRQHHDIKRSTNLINYQQAYQYNLGVEYWAHGILSKDGKDSSSDHLNEDWNTVLPPIKVEHGSVSGQISELQGRFNINNLINNGKASDGDIARLRRLLNALGQDEILVNAIVDWVDANTQARFPAGAEDEYYRNLTSPYRTANTLMGDVSELLHIKGITPDIYQELYPHVTALPGRTNININTATVPVIMSLADDISHADAKAVVEARGEKGFSDMTRFLSHNALAGRSIKADGLSVGSQYFVVRAESNVNNVTVYLSSLLLRSPDNQVTTLQRNRNPG